MKTVRLLYGADALAVRVPDDAVVLSGRDVPAVPDAPRAIAEALAAPIGSPPLRELLAARRPETVAVTISDATRPVPNRDFLPPLLGVLNDCGIDDGQVVILIGTGMHRESTPAERVGLLGEEILERVEVIDHRADDPSTLAPISESPPIRVNRRFVEADFRIVTGFIEPHLMAGFSGGRKGVCPALVDLETIQRFHGYATLADPRAETGVLAGNPCHEIALAVAQEVGVDFLLNVALTRDKRIAGVYCGDLAAAHESGCRQAGDWAAAEVDSPFDLVLSSGGGSPLDRTFYQTVKGICGAAPALGPDSTLLLVSGCEEGIGSANYARLMRRWGGDWRGFLEHLAADPDQTERDQWELQVQARVLARIGAERIWFVSDGIDAADQHCLAVRPIPGPGDPRARAQRAIDEYLAAHPHARVAAIPDGPYTMLRAAAG